MLVGLHVKNLALIEQAEPLKQLIPNTAVSGALSFLREKTER